MTRKAKKQSTTKRRRRSLAKSGGGQVLLEALRSAPHRETPLTPKRAPMPVRVAPDFDDAP